MISLKTPSSVSFEFRKSNRRYESIEKEANRTIRLEESDKEDLAVLRASTWITKSTRLIGLKYNTHTGVLHEVQDLKPDR